jgi:hypothetical protein
LHGDPSRSQRWPHKGLIAKSMPYKNHLFCRMFVGSGTRDGFAGAGFAGVAVSDATKVTQWKIVGLLV